MSIALIILLVLLAVVVVLALWVTGIYNSLVALRNRFKNAFAQIDVQLKRRYDLIPNLVETAKGYMAHERQTLEAVIAEATRLYKAGVPVDDAIKQAKWGEYATWTLASSQGPIAVRKVYEELSGRLK